MAKSYLLSYPSFAASRSTPGYEPTTDGWLRPYPAGVLRPHATLPHTFRFDPIALHYAGDNVRGLMNRSWSESSWSVYWTAINCLPEWRSIVGGINAPASEWTPNGDQAVECLVSANGEASLTHLAANNGGFALKKVVCSVYVKLAAGATAPANGVELRGVTNAGATVVRKAIIPTHDWVRHSVVVLPAGSPARVSIVLALPNATAGDRVMFALPDVVGDGGGRDWIAVTAPHPYANLGSAYVQSDGDTVTVPAASVPSQMLGLGGAFSFTWYPDFDSPASFPAVASDLTFFSCGNLYHEILYPMARDGSIWIRASDDFTNAFPVVKSQQLGFLAGDQIEVVINPTAGTIYVSGCSLYGNGFGPTSWPADAAGDPAGTAHPYTWPAADMVVGDRAVAFGYVRGSHMGAGYFTEPYVTISDVPVKSGEVLPVASGDFYQCDVASETGFRAITLMVSLGTSSSVWTTAYADGAFRGVFAGLSTITGAGTTASPYHFRVKPLLGWPAGSNTVRVRLVDLEGDVNV